MLVNLMFQIGFAVAISLLKGDKYFAFGLICSSCSPGGAGSNVWCLLLGGDVNLSLTMTFFSLSASLGENADQYRRKINKFTTLNQF